MARSDPPDAPAGPRTGVIPSSAVVAARHPELDDAPLRSRYALEGKLGRGGMGVVVEAHDRRIGRRVAIKRLAGAPTPELVSRFVREARVQGRLDHPAVVPVYDVGIQSDGRPYFAMRKLIGVTLAEVIHRQAAGDPVALERYPRARLLEAFVAVCLAIEHAHTRGVVHRDLKPGNVVLGELGEIYVIDWGVAWLAGEEGAADAVAEAPGETAGTVGYMAPEQAAGGRIDARADVYALGCILFELLAGAPLHPDGAAAADPRPSARAPDRGISAELDLVCARALAPAAADRFPSARALAEAVERHVDADRDAALRIEEAARLAARASAALAPDGARDDAAARVAAMRDAGRALALDPANAEAAAIVRGLLLDPPATLPDAVAARLAEDDERTVRAQARTLAVSYLGVVLLLPVILWQGVRDWSYVAFLIGCSAGLAAIGLIAASGGLRRSWVWLSALGHAALLVGFSRFLGPFVIPPAIAVLVAMAAMNHPTLRAWWLIAALACAGPVGAWGLEEAGVLAPTVVGDGDRLVLTATVVGLPAAATVAGLVASIVVLLVIAANFARVVGATHHDTRRRVALQAAHLRRSIGGAPGDEVAPP